MCMSTSLNENTQATTAANGNKKFRFHEIVERDDKQVPIASASALATKLLVAVPIWMALILPLTIAYQVGSALVGLVKGGSDKDTVETDTITKETSANTMTVDPADVIPRPERKHDIVVLGATGFTGGLAVRHLAKTYGTGNGGSVKWAIAGRSKAKLEAVLRKLATELRMEELMEPNAVDLIVCDTSDPTTLRDLARDTRSVATTAGPFSMYGTGVVEACAKYGTHYADITGETSFVKLMKSRHEETAIRSGARIVSLCGHDSVPWDLSYNLLADEMQTLGDGSETLESVEFGNEISANASGGTLKTMCLGVTGKLAKVDDQDENMLRRNFGSVVEHGAPMVNAINNGISRGIPKPWKMGVTKANTEEDDSLVEAPFVMSGVNYETAAWSHALRKDPKCSYKEQLLVPDFKTGLDGVLTLLMFFTSMLNPLTMALIEKVITQPGDGPDMKSMEEEYFLAITGTATGSKGSIVQSLIYFDKDAGYLETARIVVESALCMALEEDAVSTNIGVEKPVESGNNSNSDGTVGGFFSPGFALRKTLLKRLVDTGCHYEVRVVQEAK